MIPNDFGIIRQADHNLLACLFPPLIDLSEYSFEFIDVEWIDGYLWTVTASPPVSNSNYKICKKDIGTKYEYVLVPQNGNIWTRTSLGIDDDGTTPSYKNDMNCPVNTTAYILFKVDSSATVLRCTLKIDVTLPIIGFRRHRSDGANPKSIINPIPEPDPDLKKEAPEEEEDPEDKE